MEAKHTITEGKVLPFTTSQGDVPGHAILRHKYEWMENPITSVVFWTFDQEADMGIEVLVHWTEWTKYKKRKWPAAGEIRAVLLEDGQRIACTSYSVHHHTNDAYLRAPMLCRDAFKITTLQSRITLLEVAGVNAWSRSKRTPDDAQLVLDPWARDNAEFNARMAAAA